MPSAPNDAPPSPVETSRHEQAFPLLTTAEIARIQRFGLPMGFRKGDRLYVARTGDAAGPSAGRTRGSLEASVAGVFAVGDARSGSVKRVGGAIGEGAAAVAMVHQYLATDHART